MAKNYMQYKGYVGSVEFTEGDGVFHGKVVGVKPLLSFEGDSVRGLIEDFQNSVDEYLDFCNERGLQPEKPYKGSFNVRVGADLHRQAVVAAERGV